MIQNSAYSLNQSDWKKIFKENGFSEHLINYWIDGLYKDRTIWDRHLSSSQKNFLFGNFSCHFPEITQILQSEDGTTKFQIKFHDNLEVETVLIPFYKKFTICLSTQVGCAMNCSFCFTGTQGLKRNLEPGEILTQYLIVYNWLLNKNPKAQKPNIVFMGQGEPLHNLKNVKKAVEILNDPQLIGVGHRQMTLSTVGYLPGMKELSDLPPINFALSLHSPFDHERSLLIPVNQHYPLDTVLEEFDRCKFIKRQFLTIEYLLIKNFNMSEKHADALFEKLHYRQVILNLIPFNPYPGSRWQRPDENEIETFKNLLVQRKLRVMVRRTKGDDILAACGQLKINKLARRL